jgi:hypothetical protein
MRTINLGGRGGALPLKGGGKGVNYLGESEAILNFPV